MNSLKSVCHRDGTVTYWSVYQQSWERRAASVPDRELAAMSEHERHLVQRHLARHGYDETSHYRCES
jgi:hypothetical protein